MSQYFPCKGKSEENSSLSQILYLIATKTAGPTTVYFKSSKETRFFNENTSEEHQEIQLCRPEFFIKYFKSKQ